MSVVLRSLLRDPLVVRPLSRALKRWDSDLWEDPFAWPVSKRRRRADSDWASPVSIMEDMNRQMNAAISRMQELSEDLDALDSLADRYDGQEVHGRARRRLSGDRQALLRRTEEGGLQLNLDVADFRPEDLKIKLVDNSLVVEGTSEHSGENSYQQTQFKRWFKLPEGCKLEDIKSTWTSDQRLVIDLPTNKPVEDRARSIPIHVEAAKPGEQHQAIDDSAADKERQSPETGNKCA